MTTNNEYFNWHQKSALVGAIDDKHADVMERHLMLPVGSVTTIRDMYSDILRRIETSNTEGSLKFPTTRKVIYEDSSASEDMFVGIKKDFIVDTVPKQSSDSSLDSLLKYQSEVNNCVFNSAREIFTLQNLKKIASYSGQDPSLKLPCGQSGDFSFAATKRSLGTFGRIPNPPKKSYVSPVRSKSTPVQEVPCDNEIDTTEIDTLLAHPALKNVDPKMVEMINNEIIHTFKYVDWNEIAGLNYAKSIIKEAVVYPMMRPDIFTGLRRPPRGILLFGPPGTGKTLIGKCIASQSSATFFSISSASLTSKWMGEGEKMVRALFAVARARQPSVIFIDEVDSLLSQRSETENEGTRRLKTEFLIRLDGACTTDDDRVLIVGATNRPQELDEAVRRRFVKRLYVPLPELDARVVILSNLLKTVGNNLDGNDLNEIGQLADGYSGADMDSLCREASMEPLRSLPFDLLMAYNKDSLRPVKKADFQKALEKIRPSVSQKDLDQYVEWNKTYGSSS